MKVPMGPPPPRNPYPNPSVEQESPTIPTSEQPLAEEPNQTKQDTIRSGEPAAPPVPDSEKAENEIPNPSSTSSGSQRAKLEVPYSIPPWSERPTQPFFFEVLKDGSIIEQLDVSKKGAYMFGRIDLCDFILEHPTISRFHAVLQFKGDGEVFLYDLGSTHGTSVNKIQVKKKVYTEVHVGDVIRFGLSSRLYIFQGPSELMPPEADLEKIREAKARREEMMDREASLSRARNEISLADGISWGMSEDAIDESPQDDEEEVTWQTYKGQLTERQEKTRSKLLKRLEKVANMKKEIDAIRAKDISQGGLTQGQQTQIARNEQRITQMMEELDNLEETLNESIRESIGARASKGAHDNKKKGSFEEEDDDAIMSDDDDFYDRTKKKLSVRNSGEEKSVETADSLLDKKDSIINEMEMKRKSLENEKNKLVPSGESTEDPDDLDAYMTGLSSQLVHDKIVRIETELTDLQAELDRVTYLLKIADPMGEAVKKRNLQPKDQKPGSISQDPKPASSANKKQFKEPKKPSDSVQTEVKKDSTNGKEEEKEDTEKPAQNVLPKPQWLGATSKNNTDENNDVTGINAKDIEDDADVETDNFIDYKDRKKTLLPQSELESAGPGLIIRKRKQEMDSESTPNISKMTRTESESSAADAVALLLKHERGYHGLDESMEGNQVLSGNGDKNIKEKGPQAKRVIGPLKPDFLGSSDYESWVPPEGQTGDGRTALNDRLGY